MSDKSGLIYVTCYSDKVLNNDCVVSTFKQSVLQVMVWNCIIKKCLGLLVILEYPDEKKSGMNSKQYQEQVFKAHLEEFYKQMSNQKSLVIFWQDNASTKHWLKSHLINLFSYSLNAPDFSIIELLWHKLKTIIKSCTHCPTSLEKLKCTMHEAWHYISVDTVNNQINQMLARVTAVLAAKRDHTEF
jgi:hypothetical protein